MDARTRHELKQNELAEALGKLRQFDSPSTRWTLIAVVAVLVLFGGWKLWAYSQQRSLQAGWTELATIGGLANAPDAAQATEARDKLRALADGSSNATLSGYARLRLATAWMNQAEDDPATRAQALGEARTLLESLTAERGLSPELEAAAAFGLATTYESLREFDKARAAYDKIVKDPARYDGSPFVRMSQERLDTLASVATPVTFVPGTTPPPADAPPPPVITTTQPMPATAPAPAAVVTPGQTATQPANAETPPVTPTPSEPAETPQPEPSTTEQ